MACHFCRFFKPDQPIWEDSRKLPYKQMVAEQRGQCTLQSEWRPVTGLHYCAQLSLHRPDDLGTYWRRMQEYADDYFNERRQRIALQKTTRDLRRQIRELRLQARAAGIKLPRAP